MINMRIGAVAVFAANFLFLAVGWNAPALAQGIVRDALGHQIEIEDHSRIVSIGGSVTEIIFALEAGASLVAIDTTSTFPQATASLANVGYMRALSPEGVLSVEPTLILAIEGSGPMEAIDVLSNASVPFVIVPNEQTIAGTVEKIRFIANIIDRVAQGETLIQAIRDNEKQLEATKSRISGTKRVMFILSLRGGTVMAAGRGTSAEAIIELAGGENAMQAFDGFKIVDPEGIIEAAPDVILMMSQGDHAGQVDQVFDVAAIAATPAGENQALVTMNGLYLLGFGPRTPVAARELAEKLYDIASAPK